MANPFHQSLAWRKLAVEHKSMERRVGNYKCRKCGATEDLQSDHILPRSKYPGLALKMYNLRLLCGPCNRKKRAKIEIRPNILKPLFFIVIKGVLFITLITTLGYTIVIKFRLEVVDFIVLFVQPLILTIQSKLITLYNSILLGLWHI